MERSVVSASPKGKKFLQLNFYVVIRNYFVVSMLLPINLLLIGAFLVLLVIIHVISKRVFRDFVGSNDSAHYHFHFTIFNASREVRVAVTFGWFLKPAVESQLFSLLRVANLFGHIRFSRVDFSFIYYGVFLLAVNRLQPIISCKLSPFHQVFVQGNGIYHYY